MTWGIVLPPPQDPDKCFSHSGSLFGIILGLAIVFGQFIAFAPQLYSIISKKHVEGINLATYLLGTVSCTAVFLSGLIESWNNLFCCAVIVRPRILSEFPFITDFNVSLTLKNDLYFLRRHSWAPSSLPGIA